MHLTLSFTLLVSSYFAAHVTAGATAAGCCKFTRKWTALASRHTPCQAMSQAGAQDAIYKCANSAKVQYVHKDDTPTIRSDIVTLDVPGNGISTTDLYVGLSCDGTDSVGLYCPHAPDYYGTSNDFYRIFNTAAVQHCKGDVSVSTFTPKDASLKC